MKIAIDIVLLPPKEIMDLCIETNKKLVQKDKRIDLNAEDCLPHISVCIGVIDESQLEDISMIVQDIVAKSTPLQLRIENMYKIRGTGFIIRKTEALQELHEELVTKLGHMFSDEVSPSYFTEPPSTESGSIKILRDFCTQHSFQHYFPHITLGYGEKIEMTFPIEFHASKIAICHLGNHCTCRKILFETNINK